MKAAATQLAHFVYQCLAIVGQQVQGSADEAASPGVEEDERLSKIATCAAQVRCRSTPHMRVNGTFVA